MNYYGRSKPFGLHKDSGAGSPEELQHQPRARKVEGPRLPVPPVGAVVPSPGAAFAGAVLVPCPPPRARCPFGSVRALQSQLHHTAPRHSNKSSQQNLSFADRSALRSTKLKLLLSARARSVLRCSCGCSVPSGGLKISQTQGALYPPACPSAAAEK